jgi:hypothetical protein
MRIYLAGPLFSEAERAFLSQCAGLFRAAGVECFVPHEHVLADTPVSPASIFDLDYRRGLSQANALVAWLDGPVVDDGTACEIGIFRALMDRGDRWRKGIVGLLTDVRRRRLRGAEEHGGLNLFVAGAITSAGRICWSVDEAREQLIAWHRELTRAGSVKDDW